MFRSDILERQNYSGEYSTLSYFHGHIAQQEEHQSSKLKVTGSTPVMPIILKSKNYKKKVGEIMRQLNLDDFQLQLGQVRMITKDSGQTVQSIEILLGDQTKAEMIVDEKLNVMNLVVRDTVLADIPQLQCAVDKETLRNFIVGLTKLYNTLQ